MLYLIRKGGSFINTGALNFDKFFVLTLTF